jgi:hypothetical protein
LKPNLPSFGILERRSCHKNTITFDGAQPSHTIDKIPPSLVDREEENLENKLEELALTKNIYLHYLSRKVQDDTAFVIGTTTIEPTNLS